MTVTVCASVKGKPENIRGYQKFSNDVISGIPRDLITWSDNDTRKYNAFGTNTQLYVTQNDIRYDVTPITTAVSVANNFDTTLDSTNVRVSVGFTHGRATDDRVIFEGVDAFSGTSVNGIRAITSVSGTNVFYVSAANSATSTASNVGGTNGTISFLLKNQESDAIQGLGLMVLVFTTQGLFPLLEYVLGTKKLPHLTLHSNLLSGHSIHLVKTFWLKEEAVVFMLWTLMPLLFL